MGENRCSLEMEMGIRATVRAKSSKIFCFISDREHRASRTYNVAGDGKATPQYVLLFLLRSFTG